MKISNCLLVVLLPCSLIGQTSNCRCNNDETVDTIFSFLNGKKIILCGYFDSLNGKKMYQDLSLRICGKDSVINTWLRGRYYKKDTVIDTWDRDRYYNIYKERDSLVIESIDVLPLGHNFSFQLTTWLDEKIYFNNGLLRHVISLNKDVRRYTNKEIQQIIHKYDTTPPDYYRGNNKTPSHYDISENMMVELFWAAICGNKRAAEYYHAYKAKYGPDGGDAEDYGDYMAILDYWNLCKSKSTNK